MTAERTRRRQRRALIARQLAVHRDAAAPAATVRWDALRWQALDTLPDWCALDRAALRELRTIAGVVALAPAIRRCLRGDVLTRLRTLAGAPRLEMLRRRPYAVPDTEAALDDAAGLEVLVAERGARALAASVDDGDARALLLEALRQDAGLTPVDATGAPEAIRTITEPHATTGGETDDRAVAEPELGADHVDADAANARRAGDALVATIAVELRRMPPPADAPAAAPRAQTAHAVGAG